MSKIHPFIAIRPQPNHAAEVSCPPYDVISTQEARERADHATSSFVRVIRSEVEFPEGADPYSQDVYHKAFETLKNMIDDGTYLVDTEPGMFVYRLVLDGRRQVGLVCTVDAAEYRAQKIRKHENTRPDKEDDRTRHLMAVKAHAEPVLLSWRDNRVGEPIVNALNSEIGERPAMHFIADDVTHTLWRVGNPDHFIELFQEVPELYIADGHHRSAAAERASSECSAENPDHTGDEEYNRILAVIFPESQLSILPYNRVVADLNGLSNEEFLEQLRSVGEVHPLGEDSPSPCHSSQMNIYLAGNWHTLVIHADSIDNDDPIACLDVALLQDRVLSPILGIGDPRIDKRIGFVGGIRGTDELERLVDNGDWAVAFSMHATSMDELLRVADASKIMPPKSTWFEPKLRSGLFLHRFEVPEMSSR